MRALALLCLLACGGPALQPSALPDCGLHSVSVIDGHPIKRFPGLVGSTNPNRPPEGAAEIDQDTVHRSLDVTEPRRGYKASASVGHPLNAIAFKQSKLIALTYNTQSDVGQLNLYDPAADSWSSLPMTPGGLTIDRPGITGAHTRFVSAQKALYFQSAYGLTKVEDIAKGVCRAALMPPVPVAPPFGSSGPASTVYAFRTQSAQWGGPNFLLDGNWCAYRVTTARYGANGELIESEPSDRIITSDHAAGSAVNEAFYAPATYMTSPDSFYRFYRSAQTLSSGTITDEMFLVAESLNQNAYGLNSHGYTLAGTSSTFPVDVSSDTSLIVPLYTNPYSGLGIASANTQAQLSSDMVWFRNRLHLLNTSDVQRLSLRIIGTGTGGIQDGDSVVVAGVRFTFSTTAANTDLTRVLLYTGGSLSTNIENTARDFAARINQYFVRGPSFSQDPPLVSSILARYISLTTTQSGQIVLQSVLPGDAPFTVTTSSANGWDRNYTAGTASNPNAQVSGWSWSAFGQPEGNPTANNNPIGDPTAAGQRLIALKETLFAFKQDGLWKITDDGSTLGPTVQLIDPTIRLVAPESAVAVDNMIFALCDQGVVRISENGAVENISHLAIERDLFKLMAYVGSATIAEKAFGVAYLPEHTYILCLPESPNATSCTKQYVYNTQSAAWSSWNIPGGVISGAVHPDTGQLYFGRADGTLCIERKSFTSADYQDPGFSIASPTAALTKTMVFSGDQRTGSTPFAVGDLIQQYQTTNALSQRVTTVAYSSAANQTTVTLDAVPRYAWNQAVNLTVVKAIQSQIKFLPIHAGQPLTDKDWGTAYLSFRYNDMDAITVGFTSEKQPITNTAVERINNADGSNAPIALQAWGSSPWGSTIWGRQARDISLKCTMPQDFGYSGQLTISLGLPCAFSRFELSAIDVKITGSTDRIVR